MTTSLQSNLEILLDRYPAFTQILSAKDFSNLDKKFSWREQPEGVQLFEGEKPMDSTFRDFVSQFSLKDSSILFLEGFGLGVNLQKALSCQFKDIVVVEPSWERFLYSIGLTHLEPILKNPRIHWLIGLSPEEVFSQLFNIFRKPPRSLYMDDFHFVSHPLLSEMYTGYFERVRDEWDACRNQIRRSYGNLEDSLIGIKNVFQNLDFIEKSTGISGFRSQFTGIPAVVVSAGPSLKKSLDKLKKLSNKALIIANDATCSVLLNEGIEPHFVCSIERMIGSKKYFDVISRDIRSLLVAYPLVPRPVLDAFPGRKLCAYRDYTYFRILEELCPRGILSSSSSVAHMCIRFADYIGCSQIVLLGQDLSFDVHSYQSHVDGIAYSEWAMSRSQEELKADLEAKNEGELLWVRGNIDNEVPTSSTYFSFLKEFSWEVGQLQTPVINCTEGGAKIPGLVWQPIEEVSSLWNELPDLFNKIEKFVTVPSGSVSSKIICQEIAPLVPKLNSLAEQARAFAAATATDPSVSAQVVNLLAKTRAELAANHYFLGFVIEPNARNFLELENRWNSLMPSDLHSQIKCLESWFLEMKNAAQQVVASISNN